MLNPPVNCVFKILNLLTGSFLSWMHTVLLRLYHDDIRQRLWFTLLMKVKLIISIILKCGFTEMKDPFTLL